jgi:hypothetical protein
MKTGYELYSYLAGRTATSSAASRTDAFIVGILSPPPPPPSRAWQMLLAMSEDFLSTQEARVHNALADVASNVRQAIPAPPPPPSSRSSAALTSGVIIASNCIFIAFDEGLAYIARHVIDTHIEPSCIE